MLPAGYLHTAGAQIVDDGNNPVRLAGVNWYGFDCTSMVAGGLDHQPVDTICDQIAVLGFNTVRLPFCDQLVQENPRITGFLDANPSLQGKSALEIMDVIVAVAGEHGLKVILDNHRSEAGWSTQSNGLWYTRAYPESAWLHGWQEIVRRYADDPTVIGCDLRNEPGSPPLDPAAWPANGGALWGHGDGPLTRYPRNWTRATQDAGNAILEINPNLLIFVEGVRYDPAGPRANNGVYWPGGNLTGVSKRAVLAGRMTPAPIRLNVPNRLVYSAHDYGPNMYRALPWCQVGSTANDNSACVTVWDSTWGDIATQGIAPVWIGEFGTPNGLRPGDRTPPEHYTEVNGVNAQGSWFTYLTDYIRDNELHWCYWALNGSQSQAPGRDPSQPDWYGVLDRSWSRVASEPLMRRLQAIQ